MDLTYLKIKGNKRIYRNLPVYDLVELAVKRGEGVLSSTGALVIHTGKYTGRSPKDRFIVRQKSVEDKINWGETNLPIDEKVFNNLYNQVIDYLDEKELFMFDGFVGAMNKYCMGVRVISEYAAQALFANQLFNFEGGCYAKTIRLSAENEKEIYGAIKFGTIIENVVLNEDKTPNYDDESLTENTRAAYPLNYIDNIEVTGIGSQPNTIIFLTADAFGVLPPISKLSKEAVMYHFMSGYTSKLAGTERGITEPKATFSSCFGEPFMLMNPMVYANLLGERIENNNVDVYLINTGWSGGKYGVGKRVKLAYTRSMVTAALEGKLREVEYVRDEIFNVDVPTYCPNVPSEILNPKNTWENKTEYYINAEELVQKFMDNFNKFKSVPENIIKAGPNSDHIKLVEDDEVVNF